MAYTLDSILTLQCVNEMGWYNIVILMLRKSLKLAKMGVEKASWT